MKNAPAAAEANPGSAVSARTWHAESAAAVVRALHSTAQGLGAAEAARRLLEYGPNRLAAAARPSGLMRFVRQFHNLLIYLLLLASVATALLGHAVDTAVILAVVLANAVLGFLQEGKAEHAMSAIRDLLAPRAAVLRDGVRQGIDAQTLVPGDLVLLEAGDKVPADLRVLQVHGLQVQEALLTGESMPSDKGVSEAAAAAPLGDRDCLAFSGTLVTSGQARGVVGSADRRTRGDRDRRCSAGRAGA